MNAVHKISAGSVLGSAVLGLVVGLLISGLAVFFAGAGHGWGSGVISSLSVVGAPLAGIALTMRGRRIAASALLVGLTADAWLFAKTISEGTSYLSKALGSMPFLFLLWLILFVGWQLVAVIAVQSPSAANPQ